MRNMGEMKALLLAIRSSWHFHWRWRNKRWAHLRHLWQMDQQVTLLDGKSCFSYHSRVGRAPVVILGTLLQFAAFVVIFFNLPDEAPMGETYDKAIIDPPIEWLAILCSLMLGVGDACYNTQTISLVGMHNFTAYMRNHCIFVLAGRRLSR